MAETWLVGGAVRDALLGLPAQERDWVVVGSTPEAMRAAGFRQVGRDFPVFLHPETGEEYALARTERKSGHGYHGFEVHAGPEVSLEQDLERRDLTINAMARGADGTLVDPFGGQEDLAARRLRHVSPAFREDPLRVLRVARFAARLAPLGFEVAATTRELMAAIAADGELEWLAGERIWQETERALGEPRPERYFDELAACGALPAILPELANHWDVAHRHARPALQAATGYHEATVRFAAACHELEPTDELTPLCRRLPVPRRYRALAHAAADGWPLFAVLRASDGDAVWQLLQRVGAVRHPRALDHLTNAWSAAARARGTDPDERVAVLQRGLRAALKVRGRDVAASGLSGPAVGLELERQRATAVREAVQGGGSLNGQGSQ